MTQSVFSLGLWSAKIRSIKDLTGKQWPTASLLVASLVCANWINAGNCCMKFLKYLQCLLGWNPNEGRALCWHVIDTKATSHHCTSRYSLSYWVKQISKWNWQHPLTFSLQLILPRAMLEGVRAGHLQVHMNNSGLLTAFLRPGLIYKSACAVSDLHIFLSIYGHCLHSRQHVFFLLASLRICWQSVSTLSQQQCTSFSLAGLMNWIGGSAFIEFCLCILGNTLHSLSGRGLHEEVDTTVLSVSGIYGWAVARQAKETGSCCSEPRNSPLQKRLLNGNLLFLHFGFSFFCR